ncbi:uncharacterized protein LOC113517609 [Galleria mellonella]|uniref:Uncharacterized protein LOC113517609 n=1 Tax=Galleria mellonella TaxID=7137 RepID=A0A6J1WS22_GALME|nr:uncharacterized protein LOC113517609 [Galleria mellonella]XP_052750654.1 uncharacterized protein LOC113517609 [Galleria mellonella]
MVWCATTFLMLLMFLCQVSVHEFKTNNLGGYVGDIADKEYIHHVHSMIDAYRGDVGGRLVIETNALIDTKYRTWKRNADLINSILALPKGMNDAGR